VISLLLAAVTVVGVAAIDKQSSAGTLESGRQMMSVDGTESAAIDLLLSVSGRPNWKTFVYTHLMPHDVMDRNGGYVSDAAIYGRNGKLWAASPDFKASRKEIKTLVKAMKTGKLKSGETVALDGAGYKVQSFSRRPAYVLCGENGMQLFAALTQKAIILQTSTQSPPVWWTERAQNMVSYLKKHHY